MCTYIIYSNPSTKVPLLMATTRDENPARKTSPAVMWEKPELFSDPAQIGTIKLHFLKRHGVEKYIDAGIIAPRDERLGGTFLAQNRFGVLAAVNNREFSPFSEKHPGQDFDFRKMPRGGLPLDALSFDNAEEAAYELFEAVKENQRSNPDRKYSVFNLVVADPKGAWIVTNAKGGDITIEDETRLAYEDIGEFSLALWKIPAGKASLLGGFDPDDFVRSKRTRNHLHAIRELPLPEFGDFSTWHPWLKEMSYNSNYKDDPFSMSICQPNPRLPYSIGSGNPGWVTIATHLMMVGEGRSSWYGLEGQLVNGKLYMQEIDRDHPDNWSQIILSDDSLREFPGRRPPALAI